MIHLQKGNKLYVRIDYKIGDKDITYQDLQNHLTFAKNVARERYFIGGGFSNSTSFGGICVFEAENLEQAQKVFQDDPIIKGGFYRYEIYEWELSVLSETIEVN